MANSKWQMAKDSEWMVDATSDLRLAAGCAGLRRIVKRMSRLKALEKPQTVIMRLLGRFALRALLRWQMTPAFERQFVHRAGPARELTGAGWPPDEAFARAELGRASPGNAR